ncbi:MAG: transporter, partial [Nitrospiria bacterium]
DKGILDPFVISVEEAVSRFSPNRLEFNRGSYGGYSITRNGEILVSGERGDYGLGDIVLQGKFLVWREMVGSPSISLRGAIKLPTGRKDFLFGSGKVDLGLGLSMQKEIHPRLIVYLNQDVVFPTGPFLDTGFTLNPISTTIVALEWMWSPRFSWLTQLDLYTSPFHSTGVDALDQGVSEVAFGFDYALRPHVLWQLFGIENLNRPYQGAAADFTAVTTVSYRF